MKFFYLLRCTFARLFFVSILSLSCLPALAGPIQPGGSLLVDPQFQSCLDEALLTNGWTTTEEVTSLSCSNRNITLLDGIQIFINLVELELAGNRIFSTWPLDQFQQLEVLDLSDNQLVDVYPLQTLLNLRQLNLSANNQLQALDVQNIIQNNPWLTHIGVAGIAMGDLNWLPPMGFQGEYNLVELDISNTGTFSDLYPLTQYPNLRVLKAAGNQVQFLAPLDQLQQLEVLDLSDNQLVDVYPLQTLLNLTQLNLSANNQLQALDVQNIIQNNPWLTHIGVAGIAMGDLNWLPPMGPQGEYNLLELDVSNTGTFGDLYPLMQYPNLRVLKVAGNQLQYPFPLDQLQQLMVLDLSNNDLQSVLPLANPVRLTSLDLRGNNTIPCDELDALEAQLLPGVLLRPQSCVYLTPPEVTILSPSSASLYFQTDSINFVASASDVEDGNLDVFVQWSSNIDGVLGKGASLSLLISAGEHVITATVADSHGNTSSTSVNLSVQPNTAPQLNIHSIQDLAIFNEDEVVLLAADANDIEEGDISANILWTSSLDGLLGTGSSIQRLLSVGNHVITASITDGAGATVIQAVTIYINALPTLALQSPLSGALYMLQETVELRAIANDLEDGDINANIQWSSNIDGLLGAGSVLMKTLSLGTHTVTARITDSNGGTRLLTTQLVIDQIDLGITVSGKGRKRTATLSWSGSRTPVDIYKDGAIVGTAESAGTMSYRFKDQALFKVCETDTNYCSIEILAQ